MPKSDTTNLNARDLILTINRHWSPNWKKPFFKRCKILQSHCTILMIWSWHLVFHNRRYNIINLFWSTPYTYKFVYIHVQVCLHLTCVLTPSEWRNKQRNGFPSSDSFFHFLIFQTFCYLSELKRSRAYTTTQSTGYKATKLCSSMYVVSTFTHITSTTSFFGVGFCEFSLASLS